MIDYPIFINGRFEKSKDKLEVFNPYNDKLVGTTYYASEEQLEEAIKSAVTAFRETKKLPSYKRASALKFIAEGIKTRDKELAELIALEAGKPIKDAIREVERGILTFNLASEEATRISGEAFPLDINAAAEKRFGIVKRFPVGPVLAITPFNFPLNLAAHKIAPAIAAGNPVVLKVPPKTPLTMLTVAQIIAKSELPAGAINIFEVESNLYDKLVADERFKILNFTGSCAVGWNLKTKAGKKKVILELGGNAGVIVDENVELDKIISSLIKGSFGYSGQVCISIQRIYAHESIFGKLKDLLVKEAKKLKLGDPLNVNTDIGPLIDDKSVKKVKGWIDEAVLKGAKILTGGKGDGRFLEPTILTNVKPSASICCEEAFAPVVILFSFKDFKDAVKEVNNSVYGLQAGVFTNNLTHAMYAYEELEVGGVLINDVPTWRVDSMPYGGVKYSGFGREGIKYAIEAMAEEKLLVLNLP